MSRLSGPHRLAHWIEANGHRSAGYNRECYLRYEPGDEENSVTELQEPVVRA